MADSDDKVVLSRVFHKNDATHDLMIEVLKSTLAQLQDINTVPPHTSGSKHSAEPGHIVTITTKERGQLGPGPSQVSSLLGPMCQVVQLAERGAVAPAQGCCTVREAAVIQH